MTLRFRLIVTNVVVFAVILVVFATIVYERTRESEIAKLDSKLDSFSAEFTTEFEDQWEDKEFPDSSDIDAVAGREWKDIRIDLYDTTGRLLYSRGDMQRIPEALQKLALSDVTSYRSIIIGDEWFRQSLRPVEAEEQIGSVLAIAIPATEAEERLADLTGLLIVSGILALLLSAAAVFFFTGRSLKPVDKMIFAAEKISASTLDQRIELPPVQDEVHRLAIALNSMMQRIEDAFKSQRQFVADASHELRTPLTVIYSELEFLQRRMQDEESSASIEASLKEVDRLTRLVQQLLILARIDSRRLTIDRQMVRLHELLVDSVGLQQRNADKKNVTISLKIEDAVEIEGDPEHLSRAFINILDNAVKYSPESGKVSIGLAHDSQTATITITDQGPGIRESELESVFKRFYRSPENRHDYDGSGLGLAIARELIDAHRGSIRVAESSSTRTTVEIQLPLHQAVDPDDLM